MGGVYKYRVFVYVGSYQLKIHCYKYKMLYVNPMVQTKQKPILETQKTKRNLSISLQKIKSQRKRIREE